MTKRSDAAWMDSIKRKILIDPFSGCWLWKGKRSKHFYEKYRGQVAHRYVWQLKNGPIVPGLVLHHMCKITTCVNPDHLEPLTTQQHKDRHRKPSTRRTIEERQMVQIRRKMEFAKKMQISRESLGLTQIEMAKILGVKQCQISFWEGGVHAPSIKHIRQIHQAYGIPFDDS